MREAEGNFSEKEIKISSLHNSFRYKRTCFTYLVLEVPFTAEAFDILKVNEQAFHADFTKAHSTVQLSGGFEDKLVKPAPLLTYNCNSRRFYRIPDF